MVQISRLPAKPPELSQHHKRNQGCHTKSRRKQLLCLVEHSSPTPAPVDPQRGQQKKWSNQYQQIRDAGCRFALQRLALVGNQPVPLPNSQSNWRATDRSPLLFRRTIPERTKATPKTVKHPSEQCTATLASQKSRTRVNLPERGSRIRKPKSQKKQGKQCS